MVVVGEEEGRIIWCLPSKAIQKQKGGGVIILFLPWSLHAEKAGEHLADILVVLFGQLSDHRVLHQLLLVLVAHHGAAVGGAQRAVRRQVQPLRNPFAQLSVFNGQGSASCYCGRAIRATYT